MAIFKCKMCGGALEINNNETVIGCEYCGMQQTLPRLDDERKANLYDRANHFRRNNEFDKAMGIYEQILNDDKSDAEAYWSLVLCRYGIEYVEDPASHKRVPTVNRAQFTSVFDDEDYKAALQYADGVQKSVYEAEARAINEIQKGILAISQNEEPFDVFICYKESDNNGRRTQDSVIATELYHELTREGYKVFFSRITLEDKLGTAYEPYIFAALNSAKVMVVLGTRAEYFNAVWVKNEWSRYLALIRSGAKKILIPAYRDMDPYDLPEEFSHLQAQDMSKLGFMQDLIRGINKLAKTEEPKTIVKETVVAGVNASVEPLLKRVNIFLGDSDWKSADEYCEKVLDIAPECAEAYLGKLMAELRVSEREKLKNCASPFDDKNNYHKILRYGSSALKQEINGYIDFINHRNEMARLNAAYNEAKAKMDSAETEADFKAAADKFEYISDFRDSAELIRECYEKAEIARKDNILRIAVKKASINTIHACEDAIGMLQSISGWKNADEIISECKNKIEEIIAQEEAKRIEKARFAEEHRIAEEKRRIEAERIAEEERIALEKEVEEKRIAEEKAKAEAAARAKKNKTIAIILSAISAVAVVVILILTTVIIPGGKYNDAIALMDAGKYTEAISAFEALDGYKDSATKITECNTAILDGKYNDAITLMDAGNIVEAYEALVALEGYKDSTDKANSIYDKYKVENLKENLKVAKVGDYVVFGAYEQDNNTSNGKEDVEWLVLEIKDGKALVISKYVLFWKQYNRSYTDVTWETCTLRKWLNSDFLGAAFSADEKAMIPTVTVPADKNPEYSTNSGNTTQDQVFLLSITEANKYFSSDSARQCEPTDYAANGAYVNSFNGNCHWWLRSSGYYQNYAAYVSYDGNVIGSGLDVDVVDFAVRPAMWINIE